MSETAQEIKSAFAEAASSDPRGHTSVVLGATDQLRVEAYVGREFAPPIPFDATDDQWVAYRSHFESLHAFLDLALVHFDEAMYKVNDLGRVRIVIDEGGFDGAPPSDAAVRATEAQEVRRGLVQAGNSRNAGFILTMDLAGALSVEAYADHRYAPPIPVEATDEQWLTYRSYCTDIDDFLDMAVANLDSILDEVGRADRIVIDDGGFAIQGADAEPSSGPPSTASG